MQLVYFNLKFPFFKMELLSDTSFYENYLIAMDLRILSAIHGLFSIFLLLETFCRGAQNLSG